MAVSLKCHCLIVSLITDIPELAGELVGMFLSAAR